MSLRKLKAVCELAAKSVERSKSMLLSHQAKHLTPPSDVWSYCNSITIIIMQGIHKQILLLTSASDVGTHSGLDLPNGQ